jgi:hypothetical protein
MRIYYFYIHIKHTFYFTMYVSSLEVLSYLFEGQGNISKLGKLHVLKNTSDKGENFRTVNALTRPTNRTHFPGH